jgi:hypothetical protein
VLIAGGRNLYTAMKARIPFLDINQEREYAYAGYAGMVEMARQLALTHRESPVWSAVRKPAPWAAAKVPSAKSWGWRDELISSVIPAKAGIQSVLRKPGFRLSPE